MIEQQEYVAPEEPLSLDINNNPMLDSQDFEEQERRISHLKDEENIKGSLAMFGGQMDEEESQLEDELEEGDEGEEEEGEQED